MMSHMRMELPQFLLLEELLDLQKDACLFCDSRFRTRSKSKTHEEWSGGCYSDHKYDVTTTTNYVADLDLYCFTFRMGNKEQREPYQHGEVIYQNYNQLHHQLEQKIRDEAPQVEAELQAHSWKLPARWKNKREKVIQALMEEYWSEIRKPSFGDSPLSKRLEILFHNLQLGDLQLVEHYHHFDGRNHNTSYFPRGLKSHHRCWPYQAVTERVELEMPFQELAAQIIAKNKRFAEYETLFREFPALWQEVQQMPITMLAQPYNPLDGVIRP